MGTRTREGLNGEITSHSCVCALEQKLHEYAGQGTLIGTGGHSAAAPGLRSPLSNGA